MSQSHTEANQLAELDPELFGQSSRYDPQANIGQGSFGRVIKASDKEMNKIVAVKVIPKRELNVSQSNLVRSEEKLMRKLCHPNIVKMIDFAETRNNFYIFMDFIDGITLEKYIPNIEASEIRLITKQILGALTYLHCKDIVHRDLKPENIMVSRTNGEVSVVIIDFGLSTKINFQDEPLSENCGTLLYMAPEIIQKREYSKLVDIWALGVIVYNMFFNGRHPFYQKTDTRETYGKKMQMRTYQQIEWREGFEQNAKDFIKRTMSLKPEHRLTADQCLKHDWITGKNNHEKLLLEDLITRKSKTEQNLKLAVTALMILQYIAEHGLKKQTIIAPQYLNDDELQHELANASLNDSHNSFNSTLKSLKPNQRILKKVSQSQSYNHIPKIYQQSILLNMESVLSPQSKHPMRRAVHTDSDSPRQSLSLNRMALSQIGPKPSSGSSRSIRLPAIKASHNLRNSQIHNQLTPPNANSMNQYQKPSLSNNNPSKPPIYKKSLPEKLSSISQTPSPVKLHIQRSQVSKKSQFNY